MGAVLNDLKNALKEMDNAIDGLIGVTENLEGTPAADKVDSIRADLEDLYYSLNRTYKELEEQENEAESF